MPAITYEITAIVTDRLCSDFERFMIERHIPALMATGAFSDASFGCSPPGRYRIRYEAKSRETLDDYLTNHAPRLRKHVVEVFPNGVEFFREEWNVLALFENESE